MNLRECIIRARDGGEIDAERAERILREYDGVFEGMRQHMGHTQAQVEAARAIQKRLKAEAAEKRRTIQLQAARTAALRERQKAHKNIFGKQDPGRFLLDLVHNSRGAEGQTLSGQYEAIRRQYRRQITQSVKAFKANLLGMRRRKDLMDDMGRAIFGGDVKDEGAKQMAQVWKSVADQARRRFNAAGGRIPKRDDWGLPQRHDTASVRKASYEDWRKTILYRNGRDASDGYAIDLERMGQDFNDGIPFTEATIEPHLFDAHKAIRSDGFSRREPSGGPVGRALYNTRTERRFFQFSSYEDWSRYNARFGGGQDVFRVMLAHLDDMAMDTALMEELGPNPASQFRYLGEAAVADAARASEAKALTNTKASVKGAEVALDTFRGKHNASVGTWQSKMARGGSALRNYLTSTHLGSAVFSAITDFNHQRVQNRMAGFGQLDGVRMFRKLLMSSDLREVANDAGLIFENAVDIGNAVARYELDDLHVETAARMADATLRASGLAHLTEVQKQAHGLVIMNGIATQMRQSWGDLKPISRRFWTRYGIGETEWNVIQSADIYETEKGLKLVRPQEIEAAGNQRVADLYMAAIVNSTIHAVPQQDVRSRALVEGAIPAGTIYGQTIRFMLQFKSHPIKVMIDMAAQVARDAAEGRPGSALSFAANLLVFNTLLGAIAVQMKETSKGKDPRDMTTGKFWSAALLQGGGVGIFGDFLFADVNRFGGGLAETLAGPGVGFINDALKFTVGNVRNVIEGEDTGAGGEFVNMLRRYTPGGSLWYLRLAYEREVLDQLQQAIDPKAARSFRRRARAARDYDTQYFAPPGRSMIEGGARAPNFANAIGG